MSFPQAREDKATEGENKKDHRAGSLYEDLGENMDAESHEVHDEAAGDGHGDQVRTLDSGQ